MRLRNLVIRNFQSHPLTELNFKDEVYVFEGRNYDHTDDRYSNGAGKSGIPRAIVWLLWGRIPSEQPYLKDDIIRWGMDECSVEGSLAARDGVLQITRNKTRGCTEQVAVYWRGQRVPGDLREVQDTLEKLYGISWQVFCNTVFIGPDSEVAKFFGSKPAQRATLLAELVNMKPFIEAAERITQDMAKETTRRAELVAVLGQLQGARNGLDNDMARLLQQYRREQGEQKLKEDSAAKQIAGLEQESMVIRQQLANAAAKSIPEYVAQLNEETTRCQHAGIQVGVLTAKIQTATPIVGALCGSCGQIFSAGAAGALEEQRRQYRKDLQMKQQELGGLQARVQATTEELTRARNWENARAALLQRQEDLKSRAFVIRQTLENRTLVVLWDEMEQIKMRMGDNDRMVLEYNTELMTINTRLPVLKNILHGFRTEIRNMLLDEVRSQLAVHTSHFLEVLSDYDLQVRFPVQSNEKFEVEVWSGVERNALASIGEKYRAQLAVQLGLRETLRSQRTTPLDFILIDEALMGVDEAGTLAFGKLVGVLQLTTPQILITVPKPIEGLECTRILCAKTGRATQVIVGGEI